MDEFVHSCPKIIRTNDLEDRLLKLAHGLGILLAIEDVQNVGGLKKRFPLLMLVVGSDGSHSQVRDTILNIPYGNNNFDHNEVLEYIVDLKYEVVGEGEKMRPVLHKYPTLKLMHSLVEEYIGHAKGAKGAEGAKGGTTPITARFIVQREVYEGMKEARFKTPYQLAKDFDKLPTAMRRDVTIWLNAKRKFTKEQRVKGSETLVSLTLRSYLYSNLYTLHGNGVKYVLVGDAACGVPFFRSLNNGIRCGTQLAIQVNSMFLHRSTTYLNIYESNAKALSNVEIKKAAMKAHLIDFAMGSTSLSGQMPWQVNFHSSSVKRWLENEENLYL